jgi:tetratricopeptide (TPR) repeat protein
MKGKKIFSLYTFLFTLVLILGTQDLAQSKEKPKEDSSQTQNSSAAPLYEKGRISYLQFTPKGFEDAIVFFNEAIKADPKFAPAYAGLGEVYSFIGYYKMEVKEDYEEYYNKSYENMLKALKYGSNTNETQRALALSYLHLKRLKDAESVANRLITKDPNDAEVHYILWAASGRDPNSQLIAKALEMDPKLVMAHIDLGKAYLFRRGNYARATEQFKKAVELADSPQLHNFLGTSLRTQGYLGNAVTEYLKAIQLDPSYSAAYMNLGITFFYMNKYQDSITQLKKAILINPNNPEAYYHLAYALELSNSPREAVENYRTFLKLTSGQEMYTKLTTNAKKSIEKLNGQL